MKYVVAFRLAAVKSAGLESDGPNRRVQPCSFLLICPT